MHDKIFALWTRDNKFSVGCEIFQTAPTNKYLFCVAHISEDGENEDIKREDLVDACKLNSSGGFCRVFQIPENTRYVEIFVSDGSKATPIKLFFLDNSRSFDFEGCRHTTVQINTNDQADGMVNLRSFDRERKSVQRSGQRHIGWAMEYPYIQGAKTETQQVTRILPAELRIPGNSETITIIPRPHSFYKGQSDLNTARRDLAAISQHVGQRQFCDLSFHFPFVQSEKELEGMYLFVLNRHVWAAQGWRRGELANQESIDAAVDYLFNTVFEKVWPTAEKMFANLAADMSPEDLAEYRNVLERCMIEKDRHIELTNISDTSAVLEKLADGYSLTVEHICPGDHLVFLDERDRNIAIVDFDPSRGVAPLEICINGFKIPERDYRRKDEPYIRDVRQQTRAFHNVEPAARAEYSISLTKFLKKHGTADLLHELGPLLAFPIQKAGFILSPDAQKREWVIADPSACFLAIELGGQAENLSLSDQSLATSLVHRALSLLGAGQLYAPVDGLAAQMKLASSTLSADASDLAICGAQIRQMDTATIELAEVAGKVREYYAYFEEGNWLAPYLHAESTIAAPGTTLFTVQELETNLSIIREMQQTLAPLDAIGSGPEGKTLQAINGASTDYFTRVAQAINAVETVLGNTTDSRLTALRKMAEFSNNVEVAQAILRKIRLDFPDVTNADDSAIKSLRSELEEWAGLPKDMLGNRQTLKLLSRPEKTKDISVQAVAAKQVLTQHIEVLAGDLVNGSEEFTQIIELGANLTMAVQHKAVAQVFQDFTDANLTVPFDIKRRFAVWPRHADTTWRLVCDLAAKHADTVSLSFCEFSTSSPVAVQQPSLNATEALQ